jgi:hypothetical protein
MAKPAKKMSREKAEKMRAEIEKVFKEHQVAMTPVTLLTLAYSTDLILPES